MAKPTWMLDQIVDHLNRNGMFWQGDTITYSFAKTRPLEYGGTGINFSSFNSAQRAAAREAMALWDDVIAVDLVETRGPYGDIQLFSSTFVDVAGAFLPGTVVEGRDVSGDALFNPNYYYNGRLNPDDYGFLTMIHEIGHTLGLEHPGDYNAGSGGSITYYNSAEYAQDTLQYTVMSYFDASYSGADHDSGEARFAASPLLHDIAAAQAAYGADTTTRTGDTTYGFNSNAGRAVFDFTINTMPVVAIWDAGGTDTLDFSRFNAATTIDLREGGFSSTGGLSHNVAIAYGAKIENAKGGYGSDLIFGNNLDNSLDGRGGNDKLYGNEGDDIIRGGSGNDRVYGHAGNDRLYGNAGNDRLYGYEGNDYVSASSGNDKVYGHEGNDTIHGGSGIDTLYGHDGDDFLNGGSQNNKLYGGAGNDKLLGGDHIDRLYGQDGDDRLIAGRGKDTLVGNEGNDYAHGGSGNDKLFGRGGDDTLFGSGGNDTLIGDDGNDYIHGGNHDNKLYGGTGADTLIGGKHYDRIYGQDGNDTLIGGGGRDRLSGGSGDDTYVIDRDDRVAEGFDRGTDTVRAGFSYRLGSNLENLELTGSANINGWGNSLNNHLLGNEGNNVLSGGAGEDMLDGWLGSDLLYGGDDSDIFLFDLATDEGEDVIADFDASKDILAFDDVIDGAGDDIADIDAQILSIVNEGDGGDVVVSFAAGGSLTLDGLGSGAAGNLGSIADLVDDAETQIVLAGAVGLSAGFITQESQADSLEDNFVISS